MKNSYQDIIPILSDGIEYNELAKNELILSNVSHKHYLKISKEVYHLLSLIDGKKNLRQLSLDFKTQFGKDVSVEYIHKLLYERLIPYGVLKGFDEKIKEYKKPSYLKLSFIIINEKRLSRIVKWFYFLFSKKVAIFIIVLSILSIATMIYLNLSIYESLNLQNSLIYFTIIIAISSTFHEIGHASSAAYFGAKHGGIGGGFYLFSPVYYADVTDIWRLKKNERIIVNFSGMYFELIFCAILSLLTFALGYNTLTVISVIVCLFTLFNLNPFLRSDGYWIISDLTNKPNLFFHSKEKVKEVLQFLFRQKPLQWNKTDILLFMYGLMSFYFICIFLYYVLIKNPNSIIFFPQNIYHFIKNIFDRNAEISLIEYGELIIPLIFFILVFRLIKSFLKKIKKNFSHKKQNNSSV